MSTISRPPRGATPSKAFRPLNARQRFWRGNSRVFRHACETYSFWKSAVIKPTPRSCHKNYRFPNALFRSTRKSLYVAITSARENFHAVFNRRESHPDTFSAYCPTNGQGFRTGSGCLRKTICVHRRSFLRRAHVIF